MTLFREGMVFPAYETSAAAIVDGDISGMAPTSSDQYLPAPADQADFERLLDTIYRDHHHDFHQYAEASLRRRVKYALLRLHLRDVDSLIQWLGMDKKRFEVLLQYLTVPVSEMFRDAIYFNAIREHVIPYLATLSAPKIWVAGCSTGEEAWSMAILLREAGLLDRTLIYATDINPKALTQAERGIFSTERIRLYTENYLKAGGVTAFSNYYHVAYDHAIFDRSLRQSICFAEHSLATDDVFSQVDFISCRNVLIYFNRELQNRVMSLFAESLDAQGLLGLGSRERLTCSPFAAAFGDFVRPARIYQKRTEFSTDEVVQFSSCGRAATA